MGSRIPPRQPRGCSSNLDRPPNFFRQEITTQYEPHWLLLIVKRPAGSGPNVVRRGHEESIDELATVRIRQERVDFWLSESLGQDDRPWPEWPTTSPRAFGRRCRFPHRSPTDPANPSTARLGRTDLDSAERSAEPLAEPLEVATKCRPLRITANLRLDVLEAAFRQTRLGFGLHWHVWNHRSDKPKVPETVVQKGQTKGARNRCSQRERHTRAIGALRSHGSHKNTICPTAQNLDTTPRWKFGAAHELPFYLWRLGPATSPQTTESRRSCADHAGRFSASHGRHVRT